MRCYDLTMAGAAFPRQGQGFRAEVKIGDTIDLVLMAVHTGVGPAASILDAKRQKWFPERPWAEDIEDAKQKAEALARKFCKAVDPKLAFPELRWTETG
jgi:hypothetical protein